MRVALALLVALLVGAGCGGGDGNGSTAPQPEPSHLGDLGGIDEFAHAFDGDEGQPRLVLLLAPT